MGEKREEREGREMTDDYQKKESKLLKEKIEWK